jgi:hypothetical protein
MSNRIAEYRSSPTPSQSERADTAKRPLARREDFAGLIEPLQGVITKYPGAALASAFLVGVAIAWWIKRR